MASRNIYALLVGIDDYPDPTPQLHGCMNDIIAIEALLQARVSAEGDTLHVVALLDAAATRDAVIAGFEDHLAQADTGDVALFYYSGHGSQEPAPEEWWDIEPDHLDETLVLYDSREPGKWDLADKELAALLVKVAERDPHMLVVLDCCHSGSGTRAGLEDGTAERRAPQDRRQRPVSSFLFAPRLAAALTQPVGDRAVLGDSGWSLPRANHVLLSGCRANETSKEIRATGASRGAMSVALEQALSTPGTRLTYRDVHRTLSANVKTAVRNQHPQLETSSAADLDQQFLGGAVTGLPPYFVLSHEAGEWKLDGGRVHGVVAPVGDEDTLLDIREPDDTSIATGRVIAVRTGDATVAVTEGELDPAKSYRAFVTITPMPAMLVLIEGDEAAAQALRAKMVSREQSGPRLVAEAKAGEEAAVSVWATTDGFSVRRQGSERALCPRAATAENAVEVLEHIATWTRVSSLHNGATRLKPDAVTVSVVPDPMPAAADEPWEVDGHYRLTYVTDGGQNQPRNFTVTVTNRSGRSLWVALLDLTDTYGIFTDALAAGAVELADKEVLPIPLTIEVPDVLWQQGVTEVADVLKLVASTEEFDPRTLKQDDLDVAADLRASGVRGAPKSTLDRLLNRATTRRARPQSSAGEATADWFTHDIQVVSVRPHPGVAVRHAAPVEVATGVRIAPHPTLRANVQLTSAPDATRDLAAAPVPSALHDADPFGLVTTRGGETEADALLVTVDPRDVGEVTSDEPLILELDRGLAAAEHVLPFAWDGEFYVPLGFSRPRGAGCEIVIERLPAPVSTTRSLGGSIRILFRKLVGRRLGLPYDYPLLRLATVAKDGAVSFENDANAVKAAVGQAQSVLLYVHGIIGDTEGMARSARLAGDARPLGEHYDVILTFDYENLDTSIEENATSLANHLRDVGLAAGHDKRLDIVAHSMGGLVCRYMIEFVRGVGVDRLVTLGAPNAGSPWPSVQKWATAGVAFAVNSLTVVAWPVQVLGTVLGLVEKVDTALDQMESGSNFLTTLAEGTDPNLPYHVIIGDRSLVDKPRAAGLLARLAPGRLASEFVDLTFFNKPNDLAVAVSSAQTVPSGRTPAADFHILASDHVSFFSTQASLTKLAELLVQEPA